MLDVRLWQPWLGPDGWVPAGETVRVSPDEAAAICQAGQGEVVGPEVAAVLPSEHAVTVLERSPRRRKRKGRR